MISLLPDFDKTIYSYYCLVFLRFFSLSLTVTYGAIYALSHDLHHPGSAISELLVL